MSAVPWVIGPWVRGPSFYGREAAIAALSPPAEPGRPGAAGHRLWVAGLRRIGKTSLLRQLELLALDGPRPLLPLLWDLEDADRAEDLALGLADALLEAEETLRRLGVRHGEIDDPDPRALLERLGSALERRGAELLLLCDEADRLAGLARARPELVRGLWRAAAAGGGRTVLASSVRLADLAAAGDGLDDGAAALVEGFGEPHFLGAMPAAEARELVRQNRLPAAVRPGFDDAAVEAIRGRCGDHPMLLQLAGRRCQEAGDVGEGLRRVAAERTVEHLFEVDFELLTASERQALSEIARAERDGRAGAASADDPGLRRLDALGLVRRTGSGGKAGGLAIRNRLLADWLLRRR